MPAARVYLDNNATAPVRPQVAEAVADALARVGNPSSVHAEGREARRRVEAAREQVAALAGAAPENVIFTSGGTEANNCVLSPGTRRGNAKPTACLVSAVEHASVLAGHRFHPEQVHEIPVLSDGRVDLDRLGELLDRVEGPALASVQIANGETGVLQPVREVAHLLRARGHLVHSDAVQAAGKVSLEVAGLGADAVTLSAHKIGGPQGAGAIVLRDEEVVVPALLRGGGQERTRRAGTENVPAIVGFGVAAVAALAELERIREIQCLRDSLEAGLHTISKDAVILGLEAPRLPNTTCFAVPGFAAETTVIAFDLGGVAVSSGSACSSGRVAPSHVVRAMGRDDLARGAIRVSLGWQSTIHDVQRFLEVWKDVYEGIGARRKNRAA